MAGAGYKLFNTGDVLTAAQVNTYLMEQTVMVFANAAARTTALSGVVSEGMISYLKDTNAVEVYDGSNWVSSDDPNAIQNTIVDAKGDLISASAADVPARLAVGNNGETLVADSSTSTGLRYQAAKVINAVYNSAFDIWQRGTSFAVLSSGNYGPDRYRLYRAVAGSTVSRSTDVPTGFIYSAKIQRDSGNTSTSDIFIGQALENSDSSRFIGQTVTFSYWAKAGANFSAASSQIYGQIMTGTGTDQAMYDFTSATAYGGLQTITTTWTRYTVTATIPTSAKQMGFRFIFTPTGTAGADDSLFITGLQLEVASVATGWSRAGGTIAGELAACQRYFAVLINGADQTYEGIGVFRSQSTTSLIGGVIRYPVPMRTTPSISLSAANTFDAQSGSSSISSISAVQISPRVTRIDLAVTGATAGNAAYVTAGSSSCLITASAEL